METCAEVPPAQIQVRIFYYYGKPEKIFVFYIIVVLFVGYREALTALANLKAKKNHKLNKRKSIVRWPLEKRIINIV